jgi:hypothetical protein
MRSTSLLKAAADALDDGQIPLMNPFLADHDVTLDECISLAEQLAMGARLLAWALENPRLARAAVDGAQNSMALHMYTEIMKRWASAGSAR